MTSLFLRVLSWQTAISGLTGCYLLFWLSYPECFEGSREALEEVATTVYRFIVLIAIRYVLYQIKPNRNDPVRYLILLYTMLDFVVCHLVYSGYLRYGSESWTKGCDPVLEWTINAFCLLTTMTSTFMGVAAFLQ